MKHRLKFCLNDRNFGLFPALSDYRPSDLLMRKPIRYIDHLTCALTELSDSRFKTQLEHYYKFSIVKSGSVIGRLADETD
jgi:hypothetical protein